MPLVYAPGWALPCPSPPGIATQPEVGMNGYWTLPIVSALAVASAIATVRDAGAQTLLVDRVVWELATWPGVDPDSPQTQDDSGEDWLFSVTPSMTEEEEHDGFVTAGYSTYGGLERTACVDLCEVGPEGPTCSFGTIAKVGPGGSVDWFHHNGLEGTFWRVISLSDGGFLAVGHSKDRSARPYNPTYSEAGLSLECDVHRLMIVARYTHDGTLTW
jgi:hypothetical protein